MNKPIPIHWRELSKFPVNNFVRGLRTEMLTTCQIQMCMAPKGAIEKKIYLVEYDKEYVLNWLLKKVLIPLAVLEEEEVIQLIREAYNHEQQ